MGSKPTPKPKPKKDDKDWTNAPSSLEFGRLMAESQMTNSERKAKAGPVEAKKDKAMARRKAVAAAREKAAKKKPPVFTTKNIPVSPTK